MSKETIHDGLDDADQETFIPDETAKKMILDVLAARFGKKAMKQIRDSGLLERTIDIVDKANGQVVDTEIMDLADQVLSDLPKEIAYTEIPEELAQEAEGKTAGDIAKSHEGLLSAAAKLVRIKTIRNEGPRIGRNDPCPCGSGKHYKKCCLRKKE